MNRLPDDVFPEILACLPSRDVGSLVQCSKSVASAVYRIGCVSCDETFRKAVPSRELDTKYAAHFAFERVPLSMGAVALRPFLLSYRDRRAACRLISQGFELVGERDAARWMANDRWLTGRAPSHLSITRSLPWDLSLFSFVCNALERCPRAAIKLYVRSVPMLVVDSRPLPASAQTLLCCLLAQTTAVCKALSLQLLGARRPYWFHEGGDAFLGVPPPAGPGPGGGGDGGGDGGHALGQSVLHRLGSNSEGVRWRGLHHFCSSNVGLGLVLMSAKPCVSALGLSYYTFNEPRPSLDVRLFCRYLTSPAIRLGHVNLHGLAFVNGADFVDVLVALCHVRTLLALRLSSIEYAVAAPRDPALVLFQQGGHIPDLRMNNVMRAMGSFPFEALASADTRHQHLGLTRMFLDTASLRPLFLKLPSLPCLTSLDVAFNGLDGGSFGALAVALQNPACKLQRLRMASNIITNSTIDSLCAALRRNTTLQHLDIGDNVLGTSGGLALLQTVVHHNRSLRSVKLDNNHIRMRVEQLYRVLLLEPGSPHIPQRLVLLHVSLRNNPIQFLNTKEHEHEQEHEHGGSKECTDTNKDKSEQYAHFFRQTFHVRCYF